MKEIFAILMLSIITTSVNANTQATTQNISTCAFGETTGDLKDQFDLAPGTNGKIWYQGEHLSLYKEVRLKGITSEERNMILHVAQSENEPADEALTNFSHAEGYITYFSHNKSNRLFAVVAYYPGDNEFGMIFEIIRNKNFNIIRDGAVIGDSDIESCSVLLDQFEK